MRLEQDLILDGYAPTQMIEDLRKYQSELEVQNKALRYSQQEAEGASERFATLFSNVPLALMVVDEEGLVMASNAMALRLFQPLESDPPLHFLLPFVGAAHADEVAVGFLSAKSAGTSEVSEVVFMAGAQGTFTGDLHIARIENPQDELAHFICAIIDQGPLLAQRQALQESATVLRQRNEDLLLSENRMAAIINSSLDAILCVDENQCITVFNPAATTLFQCPAAQAYGSKLGLFLPAVEKALVEGAVPVQATLGEFQASTLQGGTLFVEISVSIERRNTAHGAITTIFARDLTARKRAEAQRAALETQLRESQKMQAMGTMAGGIAHDFNNILSAILGNVDLAKQDTAPHAPALTSLKEIDKAGRRARDLVRQILTFSRNEAPKRVSLQLAEVVHETVRLIKVTLPPGVDLQVTVEEDNPTVLADATQVEQALLNLCTNAVLAVGASKGVVQVRLSSTVLEHPLAGRIGLPPSSYVTLQVSDTGNGMAQETLERIFEPFFTTRQVGQGTGLGLSVVHGIMQTHQGAVDVQSHLGHGSQFTLYFPITQEAAAAIAPEPEPAAPIHGRGRHVMYVDDDQALVFLVARVLTRKGFTVTTFTDPHQAEQALRSNPQAFDLLVTDYNMPGYSGVDLLRAAKALRPDLPVALASGYVTPEIESSAMEAGASALIYKPNDVNELCETVQRLIAHSDTGSDTT
ncbi:PAS domain-containing hybrid sensor histidine kinase/response regulator [Rhodoferax saidenbachensis]|uniref:histidine kinase n=1 Tax=Rhodoferax saidenbachensis TaxID=1484693 RepID=A0A1P8KCU9_9BURK|nr:PAS domain-containing sensor histidine kinase [Rhodoferax saidenbachensis]APW43795.1 hybrid sensor histidine kinase/response regulator [Rhodoferax saidenbachensis]